MQVGNGHLERVNVRHWYRRVGVEFRDHSPSVFRTAPGSDGRGASRLAGAAGASTLMRCDHRPGSMGSSALATISPANWSDSVPGPRQHREWVARRRSDPFHHRGSRDAPAGLAASGTRPSGSEPPVHAPLLVIALGGNWCRPAPYGRTRCWFFRLRRATTKGIGPVAVLSELRDHSRSRGPRLEARCYCVVDVPVIYKENTTRHYKGPRERVRKYLLRRDLRMCGIPWPTCWIRSRLPPRGTILPHLLPADRHTSPRDGAGYHSTAPARVGCSPAAAKSADASVGILAVPRDEARGPGPPMGPSLGCCRANSPPQADLGAQAGIERCTAYQPAPSTRFTSIACGGTV